MRALVIGVLLAIIFGSIAARSVAQDGSDAFTRWKQQEDLICDKHQLSIGIEEFEKIAEAVRQCYLEGRRQGVSPRAGYDDIHWSEARIDYVRAEAFVVVKQYERAWKALMAEIARQNEIGETLIYSSRNPGGFAHDVYRLHAIIAEQFSHSPRLPAYAGFEAMTFTPRGSDHRMFIFNRPVNERDDSQFPLPVPGPGEHRERFSIVTYRSEKGYEVTSEFDLYVGSATPRKRIDILAGGNRLQVDGVGRWVETDGPRFPEVHNRERSTMTWEISKSGQATPAR